MEAKYVLALIVVIGIGTTIAYYENMFARWGYPAPYTQRAGLPDTGGPPPDTSGRIPAGTFTVKSAAYNSLDISSALTMGTDVDHNYYAYRSGAWILLGAYASGGTNVEIQEVDQGYIYIYSARHSTAAYILDAAKSLTMNSRAVSVQFVDVTDDSVKEFMVKYSMYNIPPAASGYPSTTFTSFFYADDSGSASFPTGGQAADIASCGTSQVTKYLAWYMSCSAEKKAIAVYKIEVKVNKTSAANAELVNVNIPGVGLVSASSFSYAKTDTYQTWTYEIGSDLSEAVIFAVPANTINKFDLTTAVKLTMGSGDLYTWTLTVYQLSAGQTTVTDADSADTKEGA